jgi:hypothetical protein
MCNVHKDKSEQTPKSPEQLAEERALGRRRALKSAVFGGVIAGTWAGAPSKWSRPVVDASVLPSHAQTSPVPVDPETFVVEFDTPVAGMQFTVPEGVCELVVDCYGAQGGNTLDAAQNAGTGGLGGSATGAVFAVTPNQVLLVTVGGQGGDADTVLGSAGAGGVGGGGTGGENTEFHGGGGGGGASSVDVGGTLVIAGGGGGGGHGGFGGNGGENGVDGTQVGTGTSVPGQAGGSGGAGGAGSGDGSAGQNGSAGQGGDGGEGGDGGGGGGGGLVGGGGGGGGSGTAAGGAAGGGGGSSGGPAGTSFATGVQSGNGLVRITYTAPSCG